jgi:glycosyltransferase involved in cell wall biosynthesis
MRILLLIDDFYPSTKSGAKMMHDLGEQFVRDGHEVVVVTPGDSVSGGFSVAVEDGIRVVRVRSGRLKYVGRALRGIRELRLSARIWRKARTFVKSNPCDLIVFYSPTIFFGDLVRKLKELWDCPAYLVLRDIFPQWAVDAGVIKKGLLYRYLHHKELRQYDAADVIGVESPGNLAYFSAELRDKGYRVEVLFNWMDTSRHPAPATKFRERLGLQGKVVFFYGGNIGVAQDLDNILRLAVGLRQHEHVFFLLVGSGSEVPRLQREIEKQQLANIKILPPLPQEEYLQCLSEFDVGLISLDRRLQSHNSTGKLLGYLLCGKPVLASLNPGNGLAQLLSQADAGFASDNGDDENLLNAAALLAGSADMRKRMGANASVLGQMKFSAVVAGQQILSHFASAAEGADSSLAVSNSPELLAD